MKDVTIDRFFSTIYSSAFIVQSEIQSHTVESAVPADPPPPAASTLLPVYNMCSHHHVDMQMCPASLSVEINKEVRLGEIALHLCVQEICMCGAGGIALWGASLGAVGPPLHAAVGKGYNLHFQDSINLLVPQILTHGTGLLCILASQDVDLFT